MMKGVKWAVILVVIVLFLIVGILWLGPGVLRDWVQVGDKNMFNFDADLRLEHINYVETKLGQREWEIKADVAKYFREKGLVRLEGVEIVFYPGHDDKKNSWILRGDEGWLDTKGSNMEVCGNIIAYSADGYYVRTDRLEYHGEKQMATTDDPVEIVGPKFKLYGTGLLIDLNNERVKIMKNVKAYIEEPGKYYKGL